MNLKQTRQVLGQFSDEELLEELVRRKNGRKTTRPEHWCDECKHFKTFDGPIELLTDTYNPCTKKHVMQFMAPEDYEDLRDGYGYYMRLCGDREPTQPGGGV